MSETKSFWVTLPGILTGIAAIMTASGGLLFTLHQMGVIEPKPELKPPFVLQSVDLFVSEFGLTPKVPIQSKPVTVNIGVCNQGQNRAGPFTVQWFPGENFPKSAREWRLEGMEPNEVRILTYTYSGYKSWNFRIRTKVVIDPNNTVKEIDETNNVATLTESLLDDLDGNGDVNLHDFAMLVNNWLLK
jgi:hypothetical protein